VRDATKPVGSETVSANWLHGDVVGSEQFGACPVAPVGLLSVNGPSL
jgi:hypothetical protein